MGAGKNLQTLLKDKNITVTQLSKGTGISSNTLYAIIKRDSNINATTINKIAEYLQMTVDELSKLIIYNNEDSSVEDLKPHSLDTNLDTLSTTKDLIEKLNDLTCAYQAQSQNLMYLQTKYQEKVKQHVQIEFEMQELILRIHHIENDLKTRQLELNLIREKIADTEQKNVVELMSGIHSIKKQYGIKTEETIELVADIDDKKEED